MTLVLVGCDWDVSACAFVVLNGVHGTLKARDSAINKCLRGSELYDIVMYLTSLDPGSAVTAPPFRTAATRLAVSIKVTIHGSFPR